MNNDKYRDKYKEDRPGPHPAPVSDGQDAAFGSDPGAPGAPVKNGKMSKKAIGIICAVIAALIIACVILVKLNGSGAAAEPGKITVISGGEAAAVFELQDIQAMERIDIKKHISSGTGDDEDGTFGGTELKNVLEAAGIDLAGDEKSITVKSEDGYTTAFEPDEVMADDCVLLIYEKDGELLKGSAEGGNGPFRIIAVDDAFGTRCAKYVTSIEVEK